MQTVIHILLIFHIVAGTLSLLSGLLAILLRNKIKFHRPIGKTYFWAMTVVFVTAVFISTAHSNLFLFCVAFFTYYSCLTAYRSLYLKKLHQDQQPTVMDWVIEVFFGLVNVALVVFAVFLLSKGNHSYGTVSFVFGIFGLRGNYVTWRRLRKKLVYRNYWLLAHIGGMMGSYIGAITAFVVNNANHIPLPNVVLWLGPSAFLIPLIVFEIRKHEKTAGKFITN